MLKLRHGGLREKLEARILAWSQWSCLFRTTHQHPEAAGSEPTRAELRELVKRAKAQRDRIEQLTVELNALDAQIKRVDRAKKRRPTKRKSPK